jgi:RasGEF N-terminal motif
MLKPSTVTGLTPPRTSLGLPNPSMHDGRSLSVPSFRGPSPSPLPLPKTGILENVPLSSSPHSQGSSQGRLSPKDSRLAPRPIPSPSMPSPLSLGTPSPRLSTTPESLICASPPSDHLDNLSKHLPPLLLQAPSTSSLANSSLLLDPIELSTSHIAGNGAQPDRKTSASSGSIYSTDNLQVANSPSSLLDSAIRNTERVLRGSADGTVEAGTLEGLVDRLLKETHDRAKDDEFKAVFLATYRLFATDENLFEILKRHFEDIGVSDPKNLSAFRGSIRHRCVFHAHCDVGFT